MKIDGTVIGGEGLSSSDFLIMKYDVSGDLSWTEAF